MALVGIVPLNWNKDKWRFPYPSGTPNVVWKDSSNDYMAVNSSSLFNTLYVFSLAVEGWT